MDCIFCKIVKGDIPSHIIYEDEIVLAILDISQTTKGHTLVIPKMHYKNLYELDPNAASTIFKILPKLANALKEAFDPIGLNVLINTEKPLQSVDHFHIHLLPRYENDNLIIKGDNNQSSLSIKEYLDIKTKIIAKL